MLGEHDAVDRALGVAQLDPVEVGLDRGARVVGGLAMAVQVENRGHPECCPHDAGWNFASVTSGVTSSNSTATGIPILTSSGRQSTMLVSSLSPSSSST